MSRIIKSSRINVVESKPEVIENEEEKIPKTDVANSDDEYDKIIEIAEKRAEDIVKSAMVEAGGIKDSVLAAAREDLEKIKKDAHEKGYSQGQKKGRSEGHEEGFKEGHDKGYSEGKDKSEILIKEANEIKRGYLKEKEDTLNSIEKDVIKLVSQITKKVLNQKIEENDETIINLVLKGLESLNSKDDIRIRVSKEDFEKVDSAKEDILSKVNLISNLTVDVDSNLKRGDCIIESSKGNVDVSVKTQIKIVEEEMQSLLDSE